MAKLHATITNERGVSVSKGGNESLSIRLNSGNKNIGRIIFTPKVVSVRVTTDTKHHIWEKEYTSKKQKENGCGVCGYPVIYGTDYCERHQLP